MRTATFFWCAGCLPMAFLAMLVKKYRLRVCRYSKKCVTFRVELNPNRSAGRKCELFYTAWSLSFFIRHLLFVFNSQ